MKKKLLTVLMAGAMAVTALAGCGSKPADDAAATDGAQTETKEKAESTVEDDGKYDECEITMDWWGGDSRHEATQNAVNAFMAKYPGITVKMSYGAWTDWETAKAAEYLSGNNADVQQTNFDWITKYDADGKTFLDLNTVSGVLDLTQWDQDTLDICQDAKGGLAGIPVSMTGRTFYWNKATFEQAGLSVPTSLADLKAAGPVFKEKLGDNYYPLVIGEYDRAILMAFYEQAQTGEPIIDEEGHFTLTQDQVKDGLAFIQELEADHVIPSMAYIDGEGADSMDKSARFINGEYAGIFEWDSAPLKYVKALGENGANLVVGQEFSDMGPKGAGVYQKVSLMFSISAKTEHPKECAMLVNYLLNDEEGVTAMGTERGVPSSKSAYDILDKAGKIDPLIAEAHNAVLSSKPLYWNPLFDDTTLKGDTALYNTVFSQLSYGKDAAGTPYDIDAATTALYSGYTAIAPAK